MDTNNQYTEHEVAIKFLKIKWTVGKVFRAIALFIPIIFGFILLIESVLFGVLIILWVTLHSIYHETNIHNNFRFNDCPVTPLIINEHGISYVENDKLLFFKYEEKHIFINWDTIEAISFGAGVQGTFVSINFEYIEIKEKGEKEPILIDVTYADCKPKKIVSIMQDYLQKHRNEQQ